MADNQPPGGIPGRLPIDFRPRRSILLPYNDLLIDQGLDQFLPILDAGFHLGIVLPYGLGPNEPRVFRTDDSGNAKIGVITPSAASVAGSDGSQSLSGPSYQSGTWNPFASSWVETVAWLTAFNNGFPQTLDSGNPISLATLSSTKSLSVVPPGQWAVQHSPATGAAATITKGAGGAGVRNVCTGFSFGFSAGVAIAATSMTVNLRDGASGAGTILHSWIYDLPAAIIAPFSVSETGYEIVGSAATAMTLEFTALLANLREFVNLSGHLAS